MKGEVASGVGGAGEGVRASAGSRRGKGGGCVGRVRQADKVFLDKQTIDLQASTFSTHSSSPLPKFDRTQTLAPHTPRPLLDRDTFHQHHPKKEKWEGKEEHASVSVGRFFPDMQSEEKKIG